MDGGGHMPPLGYPTRDKRTPRNKKAATQKKAAGAQTKKRKKREKSAQRFSVHQNVNWHRIMRKW